MPFVAIIAVPGMPDSEAQRTLHRSSGEAWQHLVGEVERLRTECSDDTNGAYAEAHTQMQNRDQSLIGTVHAPTPGFQGDDDGDPGVNYVVKWESTTEERDRTSPRMSGGQLFSLIALGIAAAWIAIGATVVHFTDDSGRGYDNDDTEGSYRQDVSAGPRCEDVLAEFGHGEINYEKAMLANPTCIGDGGSDVMYYDFLDGRDLKYPGWPN